MEGSSSSSAGEKPEYNREFLIYIVSNIDYNLISLNNLFFGIYLQLEQSSHRRIKLGRRVSIGNSQLYLPYSSTVTIPKDSDS